MIIKLLILVGGIVFGAFVTAAMILGQQFHGLATHRQIKKEMDEQRKKDNATKQGC